jgi:hypothetical protein
MKANSKGICCLIVLSAVCITTGTVFAQRGSGGPGGGRGLNGQHPQKPSVSDLVAKMKQALNLSDEQVGKIKTILENEMNQIESLVRSGDPQSSRSQMESIKKEAERELADVLTAYQLAQWKGSMSQRPQGSGSNQSPQGSRGFGGGEGGFESSQHSTSGSGVY